MNWLVVLALLAGVPLLSWFAWMSLQSLLQARLLLRIGSMAAHLPDRPGPAAVRGAVTLHDPLRGQGREGWLWYRETLQVYRKRGKGSSWRTESDDVEMAAFSVRAGNRDFHVDEFPSEVQGERSNTEYLDEAWLGLFHSHGHRRVVHRWLPVPALLTVLGRLEQKRDEAHLVKDGKVGLLFTPHEPGHAAWIEILKGAAGLAAVTGALTLGIYLYSQNR